jgi:hypothetical protein
MECGVLQFDTIMDYGILLLGKTKAGKTTTSHYLTHQILIGSKNDQGFVVYKLKEATNKYKGAKIGDFENKSETQIPNIFDVPKDISEGKTDRDRKMHLIDCPGYFKTYGFFRVITNWLFHFQ